MGLGNVPLRPVGRRRSGSAQGGPGPWGQDAGVTLNLASKEALQQQPAYFQLPLGRIKCTLYISLQRQFQPFREVFRITKQIQRPESLQYLMAFVHPQNVAGFANPSIMTHHCSSFHIYAAVTPLKNCIWVFYKELCILIVVWVYKNQMPVVTFVEFFNFHRMALLFPRLHHKCV